ncbi:Na+/H+ antiporter subunit D [Hyalangium gracile]|uniref:Na+/H+ antiporter subunit D n=1 Tax=Hyalangium gracile TaxID=394092 RepID=UPI001CC9F463|nr:Na+/H+ antiporter subunit D [Hyalangium gracile]
MSLLLLSPIVIPLTTAALGLVVRQRWVHQALMLAGAFALLGSTLLLFLRVLGEGTQAVQLGGWPAPFGITLVADLLSALMLLVTGLIGLATFIYSVQSVDSERKAHGFYPLLHALLMGVCGAFLAGDLFNLYVWFEVLLISSFVLLSLGSERPQLEGAVKYVALNLLSSLLFLAAAGLLYGMVGTLNLADLAVKLRQAPQPGLLLTVATLLLGAFGIKAAAFPLFFWLPPAYHTPHIAVSAVFAGLLTKVGVYALIRVFTLLFVQDVGFTHGVLLAMAGLTMITGVLGAASQMEFRRILAFHIISQIGYMLMGLGLFTATGLAGSVFYVVHHILVKTNLFLVAGLAARLTGTYELKALGGLYRSRPALALLFLVPAFALAGMPPLSGFFAKLVLLRAGLEQEQYLVVGTAAVVSVLTLFSMTKVWAEAFWKEPPHELPTASRSLPLGMAVPSSILALLTCMLGLFAEQGMVLSTRVAEELLSIEGYVAAVRRASP